MTMIAAIALGMLQAAGSVEAAPPPPLDATAICAAPPIDAELTIAVAEPLGSRTAKIGQMFGIVLDAPLVVDGMTVLPAGLVGKGEVIHAKRNRGKWR